MLEIRLFGGFEILRDGELIPEQAWGRKKTKTLLKILLTDPGRVFTQDKLIDVLFNSADIDGARGNLYGRVSQLRRALEPALERGVDSAFVLRKGEGYCFKATGHELDLRRFSENCKKAEQHSRSGQHADAASAYEEAIRLHRGEFLETDRYEEWAIEPRAAWRERYISVLSCLAEEYANLGDCHRAATACREAFNLQPWRESILRQLVRYHHSAGERSEAIMVYNKGVLAMRDVLGAGPSLETQQLRDLLDENPASAERAVSDKTRVAVLPLVNLSPSPEDEYFADGLTEELIFSLSQVTGLKVIAQTSVLSYKNTRKTLAQIGRELCIGTALEGSVRKAGGRLRVTIQLIDAVSEEHIWAEEYERPLRDVFAIQSDIARQVSSALRVRLLPGEAASQVQKPTQNLEAHLLLIKGRQLRLNTLRRERYLEAITYLEQAVELDTEYAAAWAELAGAHIEFWFWCDAPDESVSIARKAAHRALDLDPHLAEGYISLALVKWAADQKPNAAEPLLTKALELAPRDAIAHWWYSRLLHQLGREGESLVETLKMREIDPCSSGTGIALAIRYAGSGQRNAAISEFEALLLEDPSNIPARVGLAYIRMEKLDWSSAERELIEGRRRNPDKPWLHWHLAEFWINTGKTGKGLESLATALSLSAQPLPSTMLEELAIIQLLQRDYARALEYAEQAIEASPRIRFAYWIAAICHCQMGNYKEGLGLLEKSEQTNIGPYNSRSEAMKMWIALARGMLLARGGDLRGAREALKEVETATDGFQPRALILAGLHFELGELETGFEYLDLAIQQRCKDLRRLRGWPFPKSVLSEPRFSYRLERIGLPPLQILE